MPPEPPATIRGASSVLTGSAAETLVRSTPVGISAGFEEQTRELLRRRLLACMAVATIVLPGLLVGIVAGDPEDFTHGATVAVGAGFTGGLFVAVLATLVYVWRHPGLSLTRLRALEIVFFGVTIAGFGYFRYTLLANLDLESPDPRFAKTAVIRAVAVSNISNFLVLFYYGALIPNTLRRGLTVVGLLSLVPLTCTAAAAAANPGVRPFLGLVTGVTLNGLFMTVAAAAFCAGRSNTLQRAVYEAKQEAGQVGPYMLRKLLGKGGMGEVWLAEHRLLKRPCAVKFIRAELAANSAAAARFEREVRAVTALTHFHTVRVYDYGRADDGGFYYVMEYLDGPTLDRLVRDAGPLDPGRAVYLLLQVCEALAEAHSAGLIHRDLKPANILLAKLGGQHDVAKLLDFGLVQDLTAVADDRLTQTGTVLGTPAYMCPEQAGGEAAIDARGDIYSLGAVGFFALTGRPPFDASSVGKLIAAHLTLIPPRADTLRRGVPADLVAVIARCLEKNPADRFASASELGQALATCRCAADWSAARSADWWTSRQPVPPGNAADITRSIWAGNGSSE